jgi:hypothetical protein
VPREEEKLRLGKGAAFVKSRLKRLRQVDDTWEADFPALPKPVTQSGTHYLGMVVAPDGSLLADSHVEGRPTVNDMATLLAHAMRRPLTGKAHRPRRLHVRGHPQWRELFPRLEELGIKVAVHGELPKVQRAYQGYLRQQREAHRAGMVRPTPEQQGVEKLFPSPTGSGDTATSRSVTRRRSASSPGRWATAGWPSRTTGPARWPRRWRLWNGAWPGISSGRGEGSPEARWEVA